VVQLPRAAVDLHRHCLLLIHTRHT
jgi:hypothetical protein